MFCKSLDQVTPLLHDVLTPLDTLPLSWSSEIYCSRIGRIICFQIEPFILDPAGRAAAAVRKLVLETAGGAITKYGSLPAIIRWLKPPFIRKQVLIGEITVHTN